MRVVALAIVLAAGPALAGETPAPKADDDREQVICKKERPTGSHLPVRVCLTKAEWERMSEVSQGAFKDAKRRPSKGVGSGPELSSPQ